MGLPISRTYDSDHASLFHDYGNGNYFIKTKDIKCGKIRKKRIVFVRTHVLQVGKDSL